MEIITKSDLRQDDVLLGRGRDIQIWIGNVRFRQRTAAWKDDYYLAKRNSAKRQIADEVIQSIRKGTTREGVPPTTVDTILPGRFLRLMTKEEAQSQGVEYSEKKKDLWTLADETSIMEKVKQLLRQDRVKRVHVVEEKNRKRALIDSATGDCSSACNNEAALLTGAVLPVCVTGADNFTKTDKADGNLYREIQDMGSFSGEDIDNDLKPGSAERETLSLSNTDRSAVESSANMDDKDLKLLHSVNVALETAKVLAAQHRAETNIDQWKLANDLNCFGQLFFQSLTDSAVPSRDSACVENDCKDNNNSSHHNSEPKKQGCGIGGKKMPSEAYNALLASGLPISLCILVSSLLDATDEAAHDRYVMAADVQADLEEMVSNPRQYLFDPSIDFANGGVLDSLGNHIYGRDQECSTLKSIFHSVFVHQSKRAAFLSISGAGGSGKTSLIDQFRTPMKEYNVMFLTIKFDAQCQEQPVSRIFIAIEHYFQVLLQGDPSVSATVGIALKNALGSEITVLKDLIPSLGVVIGGWGEERFDTEQKETYALIVYYLRKVVQALAGPTHPLVVVFDDLQWSDEASVEIIWKVLMEEEMNHALFVACFRANEVGQDHPWSKCLLDVIASGKLTSTIALSNLKKVDVNSLLHDMLHLPPRLTQPLANQIHSKTDGNPMFIKELIRLLHHRGLLQYSSSTRRWVWDIDTISTLGIADNAVDLIIDTMNSYESEIKLLLRMASCLGSEFEKTTLSVLYSARESIYEVDQGSSDSDTRNVSDCLRALVSDGVLLFSGSRYAFSHDQLWEAAMSLTPSSEREEMYLQNGRILLRHNSDSQNCRDAAIDQLNRGLAKVTEHNEELQIAELNRSAGERALNEFAFDRASVHFLQGCVLLQGEDWNTHYDLCVRLYSACAETQLVQGYIDQAKDLFEMMLTRATRQGDKLYAQYWLVDVNITKGDVLASIRDALDVLAQLGEEFPAPSSIHQDDVRRELGKTQAVIASNTIESILQTKSATDEISIWKQKFLFKIARTAKISNQQLTVLVSARMIQLSLSEGVSPQSCLAFSTCAFIFCGVGNLLSSSFCLKTANGLLRRFNNKYIDAVKTLSSISIQAYLQPLQACIEELRACAKRASARGDASEGQWAVLYQVTNAIVFVPERRSNTLDDVEKEIRRNINGAKKHNHHSAIPSLICLQAVLNLKEPNMRVDEDDPSILTGAAMNQEEMIDFFTEKNLPEFIRKIYFYRLYLAYIFRKFAVAAELATKYQAMAIANPLNASHEVITATFYLGLIAAERLRQSSEVVNMSRWRAIATESQGKLERWVKFGQEYGSDWNVRHKHALLRAEILSVDAEDEAALAAFDEAIHFAGEHCYINEHALACERLGFFNLSRGEVVKGEECLRAAKELYTIWGARRKASDVGLTLYQRCNASPSPSATPPHQSPS